MTLTIYRPDNKTLLASTESVGMSSDALLIEEYAKEIQEGYDAAWSISRQYQHAVSALLDIAQECSEPNWDSSGAEALDYDSLYHAIMFSRLLPVEVPLPEILIDPRGNIEFEWSSGPRCVFSVTIRGNGELLFAGLFGPIRTYGTEWLGDELSENMRLHIKRAGKVAWN